MAPGEDFDSGMESQETSAKDTTPEKRPEIENDLDDEPDETVGERVWGLTEMFPESVRNATNAVVTNTASGIKSLYNFSRNAMWIMFSTSIILFAPVIFEVERAQLDEMQRNQQKQYHQYNNPVVMVGTFPRETRPKELRLGNGNSATLTRSGAAQPSDLELNGLAINERLMANRLPESCV